MNYYIYIWYVRDTTNVFYVGRGHGNRYKTLKKRSKYFHEFYDNQDCSSIILLSGLSEEESILLEPLFIFYYKQKGMCKANIHNGGLFGGNVIANLPYDEKKHFVEKMTKINKCRCSSEEFKKKTSVRMKQKYESPKERELQHNRQKQMWTDQKRIEQSNRIKQYYANNPNDNRWKKTCKPCVLEINGSTIYFPSYKELKQYLYINYGFCCSRKIEQDMLHNKTAYHSLRAKYKILNGMKMYYVV